MKHIIFVFSLLLASNVYADTYVRVNDVTLQVNKVESVEMDAVQWGATRAKLISAQADAVATVEMYKTQIEKYEKLSADYQEEINRFDQGFEDMNIDWKKVIQDKENAASDVIINIGEGAGTP